VRRRNVLGVAAAVAGGAVVLPGVSRAGRTRSVRRAYLGSYTTSGGAGIGVATVDATTGNLAVESWLRGVSDPSWLDLSPGRRTLYAVSESTPNGRVSALSLDDQGRPSLLGGQRTGSGPAHVCVHPTGRYLFTSLYDGGSVVVHPILADGRVGASTDVVHHTPDPGQSQPHAHQIVVDPSGRWILSVDLGVDSVYVYELDAQKGHLRQHDRVRLRAGAGPRHLAFHPGGNYAYVAGELDSTLTVCGWRDGTLTPGAVLSTVLRRPPTRNYPAEVVVSADGRFGYVSNRGDNSIAVFAATADGSALRLVATPTCGGDWPRHLALSPDGRWLYAANQNSGEVVWFELDRATGLPVREGGRLAATAVAHVLFA
jgi:6-phosphogluconolactonase (cycloisomerase 2 family)